VTKTLDENELELLATTKDPAIRSALMNDPKVGSFACPHCGCHTEVSAISRGYGGATLAIVGNGQTAAIIDFEASGPIPVILTIRKGRKQRRAPMTAGSVAKAGGL
jgi:hypothetical protein